MSKVALTMLSNFEVAVMMRLRHPRIVKFLGFGEIVDPPMEGDDVPRVGIFVILEYAAGGDLIHRLKNAAGSVALFSWIDRVQCAMDIAEGMAYIHSEGFLHRDLKSLNVLCDQNGRCLIGESLGFLFYFLLLIDVCVVSLSASFSTLTFFLLISYHHNLRS